MRWSSHPLHRPFRQLGEDAADVLALTFALPVSSAWDLPPVQDCCVTEHDLHRNFDGDYWDKKVEFDE